MVKKASPICNFGEAANDFSLPGTDGKTYTLDSCRGANGTLVMFICNHCPFVKAIREKLVRDTQALESYGIKSVAIMSNDPTDYVEDSFDNMQKIARQFNYTFPYLFDKTQAVAEAYGAICTPDFFGYNADLKLQYRGRLDDSGMDNKPNAKRELFLAMKMVAQTGKGPKDQHLTVGCSIKWLTP